MFLSFWSTWTLEWLPTYLEWTIMDIWLTTYLPQLVHVVCERPLIRFTRISMELLHIYLSVCLKITSTIFETECFFNLFLEVSLMQYIIRPRAQIGKKWDLEAYRKIWKRAVFRASPKESNILLVNDRNLAQTSN